LFDRCAVGGRPDFFAMNAEIGTLNKTEAIRPGQLMPNKEKRCVGFNLVVLQRSGEIVEIVFHTGTRDPIMTV
jgi:hypothetical protein